MKYRSLFFAALLVVAACAREEQAEDFGLKTFNCFTVSVEESEMTKVHMEEGGAVKWDVGDCIGIFSDTQAPVKYVRGEDGKFYGDPVTGTQFYAFSPYTEDAYDSNNPLKIWMSVNMYSFPMVAKGTGSVLSFRHTCGLLHFINQSIQDYSDVFLLGNNDEDVGGMGVVDLSQDSPVFTLSDKNEDVGQLLEPYFRFKDDREEHIYFVVPPMLFENGFVLRFIVVRGADGIGITVVDKITNKPVTVARGVMKSYTLDLADEIRQNEYGYDNERAALISIYNALDGDNWINNENWCTDKPLKEWYGVEVDWQSGHVNRLWLPGNHLRGALPDVFGDLMYLKSLSFNAGAFPIDKNNAELNKISGTIPPSFWKLINLESLDLSGNSISGTIPEDIRNLKSLSCLYFEGAWDALNTKLDGYEYLSGPIPESIGELKRLGNINFQCQGLSGPLPNSITELSLYQLQVNNNYFSGPLPDIKDFSKFYALLLNGNEFSGSIPACYSKVLDYPKEKLNNFWIFNNKLSGQLPIEITSHPNFSERAYDFIPYQKEGYMIDIESVPASKHTFETLDGGTLDLGAQYGQADYTMIVRWAEWCNPSRGFVPHALGLAKKYENKGLQTIWAYGGGEEEARNAFMKEMGLDSQSYHIVESHSSSTFDATIDYAIWQSYLGYRTPFVEVVDREGNIVFVDDDEGFYRLLPIAFPRTKLEAFLSNLVGDGESFYLSTDYSADGRIHTLQTATKGNGIDIVLMGDAYSDRLIADGTYGEQINKAVELFFDKEPYKSLRACFNVYYVDVVSKNEIYDGETTLQTWYGTGSAVGGNHDTVTNYAKMALSDERMENALIIVLMNRDFYAGTCYMSERNYGDYGIGPAIAYFPTNSDTYTFAGMVSHEAGGHGFAKLGDEYSYSYLGGIPEAEKASYMSMVPFGWWKNVDFTSDPSKVKWAQFITDERYGSENIGVFEGACTYDSGAWRPTENSIMNNNADGFNAPSRYAIWYRINKLAYGEDWTGTYEDFVAFDMSTHAATTATKSAQAKPRNYVERPLPPLPPPVVLNRNWKEK